MKRIICLLLAVFMGLTAFAEPLTDELSALTLKVKDVTGSEKEYTSFDISASGDRYWLEWYGEDGGMSVTADADGTVYYMWMYEYDAAKYGSFGRFTALDNAAIEAAAREFLNRAVTKEGWGYEITGVYTSLTSGTAGVSGYLTYNGLKTDITLYVDVNTDTGSVKSFHRSDAYCTYTDIGRNEAQLTPEAAFEAIMKAVEPEAQYMVVSATEMARLVYKPEKPVSEIAVNAATGELIESSPVHTYRNADMGTAEEAAKASGLTEYEVTAIGEYEGALSLDELEAIARGMKILGITDKYTRCDTGWYTVNGVPCAEITFSCGSMYRWLRLNAENGSLMQMNSYNTDPEFIANLAGKPEKYKDIADKFLEECCPDYAVQSRLGETYTGGALAWNASAMCFDYTRMYDGYPFYCDTITVTVNPVDKSVCGYYAAWDNGQEFYSAPETPIGVQAAKEILLEGAEAKLEYRSVYDGDKDEYSLVLAYVPAGGSGAWAVDAETGKAYCYETAEDAVYTYEDTAGMLYADEIVKLGQYGVGIEGCGFTAQDMCTPEILMTLTLQAAGRGIPENLTESFRQLTGTVPAETVTRAELARLAVCAAGYSNVLNLTGIFTLPAPDFDICTDDQKAALAAAYALNLIDADENGCLNPDMTATAAEAAHAVYAIMNR